MLSIFVTTLNPYIKAIFERISFSFDDQINENLEDFLLKFVHIISHIQSPSDQLFYNKTKELEWITPQYLIIRPSNVNENSWIYAINEIKKIDNENLPSNKLQLIQNVFSLISSSISIFGNKEDTGSIDDIPLIIVFCVIRACPKYFTSDIK